MELLYELVVSALIAVFFSFLISKLVSMAMAGGDCSRNSQVSASQNIHQEIVEDATQDVHLGERLQVGGFESEERVEFVAEEARFVDHFVERSVEDVEIEKSVQSDGVMEAECCELPAKSVDEFSGRDNELSEVISGSDVNEFQLNKEFVSNFPEEVIVEKEIGDDVNLLEQKLEIGMELSVGKDIIEESEEIQAEESEAQIKTDEEKIEIDMDCDDDDWEGIERSELENTFAKAAKFVENEGLKSAGSDVQMVLYGLHKVATEGPCREQAPMPLKVAARAKWNAWQRLGNMSPDVAMEQYVALVSDNIPGWKEDKFVGYNKPESLEVANIGAMASDTCMMPTYNHPDYTEQSTSAEGSPSTAKNDLTGGSFLESLTKE